MKCFRYVFLILAIFTWLWLPLSTLGSDISTATYYGTIIISNNGSSTASNVSTVMTLNSTSLIDSGWVDSAFTRAAIRNSSGADVPFMPSINASVPWSIFVPSIGGNTHLNDIIYLGPSNMSSTKYYFPGSTGMAVTDNASLELGGNFTTSTTLFVPSTDTTVISKPDAISVTTVSGNATAIIYSSTTNSTTLYPTGDNTTGITSSTNATHWQAVSDNDDATYIYTAVTSYQTDIYTLQDATDNYSIYPIASITFTFRMATGSATYAAYGKPLLKINGVSYNGTEQTTTSSSFVNKTQNYTTNPATGLSWTWDEINSLLIGINLHIANIATEARAAEVYVTVNYYPIASTTTAKLTSNTENTITVIDNSPFFYANTSSINNTPPSSTGLVLNLPLHQTNMQGNTLTSIDANQFTANVTGATWGTQGRTFDGVNDYASIPDNSALDISGNISIIMWMKTNSSSDWFRWLSKALASDSGTASGAYRVVSYSPSNHVRFGINEGTSNEFILTDGTWTFFAGVYDSTKIYAGTNGNLDSGLPYSSSIFTNNQPLNLMADSDPANYQKGSVGEVLIYSRALSPSEVSQLYNSTKWRYDGTISNSANSDTYFQYDRSVAVPNTSSNWMFFQGVPYADSVNITVGGTLKGSWAWQFDSKFYDASGNGNTATPSFRTTSSDANVSASLSNFQPIATAQAPAYAVTQAPDFITGNVTTNGTFQSGNVTNVGMPFEPLVDDSASTAGVPNIWLWGILAGVTLSFGGLGITWLERKYGSGGGTLLFRIMIGLIIFGLMIAWGKFDFWMLLFYLFIVGAAALASKQYDFGAQAGELSFIGFLSQVWLGLTVISRILQSQLLTADETGHLNTLMFTQDFTIGNMITVPIVNFDFFTDGVAALLRWSDYGTIFTGNAQMIQYFLYSLTAIASFIVFIYTVGLFSSYLRRG